MTLPCKDCGHQISPAAKACPSCGCPIINQTDQAITIIFGIIGAVIIGVIALRFLL